MYTPLSSIYIYEQLKKIASSKAADAILDANASLDPYRSRAESMHWWDRLGSNVGTGINNLWNNLTGVKFRPSRDSSIGKYQPSLSPGQKAFSPYFNSLRNALEKMDEATYNFANSGWMSEDYAPAAKQYMNAVIAFKRQLDDAKLSGNLSPEEVDAIYKMYEDSLSRAKDSGIITNSAIAYTDNGNKAEIVPDALLSDLSNLKAETFPSSGSTQSEINSNIQNIVNDSSLSPEEKKQQLSELKFKKVQNNIDEYNRLLKFRNEAVDPVQKEQYNTQLNTLASASYNELRRMLPEAPELQPAIAQLYQRAKRDNLAAANQIFNSEMSDYSNKSLSQRQRIGGYEKWKSLVANPETHGSYHNYLKSIGQSNPYQQALTAKNNMDIAHSYFKNKDGSYNYNLSWQENPNNPSSRNTASFVITDEDKKIMNQFNSEPERRLWFADKYMTNIPESVRNNFIAGTTRKDNLYRSPYNGNLMRTADSDEDIVERNKKTKSLSPTLNFKNTMTNWDK